MKEKCHCALTNRQSLPPSDSFMVMKSVVANWEGNQLFLFGSFTVMKSIVTSGGGNRLFLFGSFIVMKSVVISRGGNRLFVFGSIRWWCQSSQIEEVTNCSYMDLLWWWSRSLQVCVEKPHCRFSRASFWGDDILFWWESLKWVIILKLYELQQLEVN